MIHTSLGSAPSAKYGVAVASMSLMTPPLLIREISFFTILYIFFLVNKFLAFR